MNRLVFIDDDKRELDEFGPLIEGEYTYTLIHWPNDREKLFSGQPPDLFVSDLYLPSADGDRKPTTEQTEEAASAAQEIAQSDLSAENIILMRWEPPQPFYDEATPKIVSEAIESVFTAVGLQLIVIVLGSDPEPNFTFVP
jgi:hypothetical protein